MILLHKSASSSLESLFNENDVVYLYIALTSMFKCHLTWTKMPWNFGHPLDLASGVIIFTSFLASLFEINFVAHIPLFYSCKMMVARSKE